MKPFMHGGPAPVALLAAAALGLMAGTARGEPAPPYLKLLQQAQEQAPRLAESRAETARAEGLARQAGARPNPTIGVEVENFSGSAPFNGLSQAETTASLAQPIELGGKRPARIAAGRASVEAARIAGARARIDFAAELAQAYAEAEAAVLRVELAQSAFALAREDARAARALVGAGKESEVRVVQVEAAVQAAGAEVEEARTLRATAFGRLTALAGSSTPYTDLAGSLLDHGERVEAWSPPDPLQSPGYLSASAEREAAARRVRVEQTKAAPDVTLSLGVRRLAGDDATAMVGGLSLPFPVFDRNRGNVDAARAELMAAEARQRAALLDAEADARVLVIRLDSAQARVKAARDGEAAAAEAYRLARLGYEGGKLPLLELLTARRALSEARAQSINALLERLRAEVELARLKGVTPFGEPS